MELTAAPVAHEADDPLQTIPERVDPATPRPPAKPSWKDSKAFHNLLALLAYAAGAGSLYYVFHKIKLSSLLAEYKQLHAGWLVLAMLASMGIYCCNALRWLILVRPILREQNRPARYWRTLQAVYIGLFFNEVLPLRPGEIIRCYLISRWSGLALSSTFAAAILERVLDGVWLITGFYIVAILIHLPRGLLTGAGFLLGGIIACLITWLIWAQRSARHRRELEAAGATRRKGVKSEISTTLELTSRPQTLVGAAFASALPITCNIFSMWFLMLGAGLNLPFVAAMAVLLIIRVGTVVPNTPGNVGPYQFFCFLALKLFGVSATASAAFSLLSFGVFTVPLLFGGAIAVIASGFNLRTLLSAGKTQPAAA